MPLTHEPLRTTFTTVDEEKRRQRDAGSHENWGLYAQFLLLVFALTAIVWYGWRLMKPHTADELYADHFRDDRRRGQQRNPPSG